MQLKGKRLLLLGGSRITCEIIRHARKLGVETGVTDWYALENSPAKQLADEAYFENTSDIEAMQKLIQTHNFDGVLTGFTDSVLPFYSEMCTKLNLPAYGTKEQFDLFIDKKKYKELMRQFDVPTITEYCVDLQRFEETTKQIQYPVIVKPTDSSGSRGITVCHDQGELRVAISFAEEASKEKSIVVEQYLDAPEVTVFWVFVNGEYYLALLGNRHVKHNQRGELPLPAGYTYPAPILPKFLKETAPKMKKMFRSVGLENGYMFMQCKVQDDVCMVYDIGYRLTGSLEYINLKETCGFDPLDMLICYALTGDMGEPNIAQKVDPYLHGKYAYNVSLLCKPGTIKKMVGMDEIRNLPGVIDVIIAHPVGDTITEKMKGRLAQITVRILGKADSVEQMKTEMLEIQRLAHILSEDGEEMILDGLEASDFDCFE